MSAKPGAFSFEMGGFFVLENAIIALRHSAVKKKDFM
jgi:hypothetical protein